MLQRALADWKVTLRGELRYFPDGIAAVLTLALSVNKRDLHFVAVIEQGFEDVYRSCSTKELLSSNVSCAETCI